MKQLLKISNAGLNYKLNLNYNNVYARLKMLLGKKASLFADISTKSSGTTWYSDDDEVYSRLSEAPKEEVNKLSVALNDAVSAVRKELSAAPELANYVDDILEIPDYSFVFYRKDGVGYKFILAGWGCKYTHQSTNGSSSGLTRKLGKGWEMSDTPVETTTGQTTTSEIIDEPGKKTQTSKTIDVHNDPKKKPKIDSAAVGKPIEPEPKDKPIEVKKDSPVKKTQHVVVRVVDQKNTPVDGEIVRVHASTGEITKITTDQGIIEIGNLPYGDSFRITFPNVSGNQERTFEVEPGVETYDAFIKKLIKYTPLLFVEDQNGNAVQDYNVKVVIKGQDMVYNSGMDGVIQLPTMQEGQKFVVIDTANYANTEEYSITQTEAKTPYHFRIKTAEKTKVGITVLNKVGRPMPKVSVNLQIGDVPCQQLTAEDGRAEFPCDVFIEGDIPVSLIIKGKGKIKSNLRYTSDITEYTIQLHDKSDDRGKFDWKWLSLIPLLLLLGWGGSVLYKYLANKASTIAEMESGVVMTLSQESYWVDLNVEGIFINGNPLQALYFTYNEGKISNRTYDPDQRKWSISFGTGFLISKDGLIATNRHIADPIPPEDVVKKLRNSFQADKAASQKLCNNISDTLRAPGLYGVTSEQYVRLTQKLKYYQDQVDIFDKILNIGDFKVKVDCRVSVAFTGTRVQTDRDFIPASLRISGEPGGVTEKDVAIIQINKKNEIPEDAFIFTVPEKDLMDEDIPDDYDITVLGYNAGFGLQDMDLQDGIKPQAQHGKITNRSEKYRVGYDAPIYHGSSGSPVINKRGQLVAVNNSGVSITQGFNYGVRTKYLKELLDDVQKKSKK